MRTSPTHPPTRPRLVAALALTLSASALLASARVRGQATAPAPPAAADPAINRKFNNPNVKELIGQLESADREVYARREAIVKALGLKKGMSVADIGAGTGLFTRLIADRVGREGTVFAVEVADPLLQHIQEQSKKLGQTQVRVVRGSQESTGLAVGAIDLAFLCDAYHHLERPEQTLASIKRALRPGGQFVVVDLDRAKNKDNAFVREHVRAEAGVFAAEIKAAGFEPLPASNAPALKENFFLRFRKPPEPPKPPSGPVGG
jgi:ubiquinone/menaquinone biosynthesis C-methylase UbiE